MLLQEAIIPCARTTANGDPALRREKGWCRLAALVPSRETTMCRVILLLVALALAGCGPPLLRLTTVDPAGGTHNFAWEAAACADAVRGAHRGDGAACWER